MWEDPIVEELHQIRAIHAESFDYDFNKIFADWLTRQAQGGHQLVSPRSPKSQGSENH